jgi:hypothetical protein
VSADISGLEAFVADLARVGLELERRTQQVVAKGALNIKRDWQANARATAGRHARLYPASIGYDLTVTPAGASAVIGPDKDRPQGALGNLLEFGTSRQGGHLDGARALAAEEPRFIAAIEALGGELL